MSFVEVSVCSLALAGLQPAGAVSRSNWCAPVAKHLVRTSVKSPTRTSSIRGSCPSLMPLVNVGLSGSGSQQGLTRLVLTLFNLGFLRQTARCVFKPDHRGWAPMSSRLKQARAAKGWSQARLIREIEEHARKRLLSIATPSSLKVYVSEWENGRRKVGTEYATILRALLGLTDAELFTEDEPTQLILAVDGYSELVNRIDDSRAMSPTILATLKNQTELLRSFDRELGGTQLVDQMSAHLETLQETLTFTVLSDERKPLASALSEAATLAAWQALDAGAADRAWRRYELAKTAARDADQTTHLAYAMGEQAYVLVDAGKVDLAVKLVREARQIAERKVSPRLAAWLASAEAEMCALAGDFDGCRRALDQATTALPDQAQDARDPDLPSIFLNSWHLARWRGHSLALIGDDQAISELYGVLDAMNPTFTRAESGLRCDLAQAHQVRGEYAEALEHLRTARLLANRTGSVRYRRRIERLTGQM